MLPRVKVNKQDGQTGVVKPGGEGVLAIIAPSGAGTVNQPQAYTDANKALTDLGYGLLVSSAAYVMGVAGNPCVLIKGTGTTAGAYSAVTHTGAGTSVVSAHAATKPLDDFTVVFTFTAGGTIGVAGILFTYSLDGGVNVSAVQALGTATSFTIPNTGVQIDFAAGTILLGQTEAFTTTGPRLTQGDMDSAMTALAAYGGAWEGVLVLGIDATSTIVGDLDTTLSALEAKGKYRFFGLNTRKMNAGESEATFSAAMTTAAAAMASIRGFVGTDCADMADLVNDCVQQRPTALFAAARAMAVPISVDLARVSDGPLSNCAIADVRGNPNHHNEDASPGLDDLRLVTLRTIPGRDGAFITNPNLISSAGSDYVYLQHARVMNKAAELAFQSLTGLLSSGITKNNAGHITEGNALQIEELVKPTLVGQLFTPKHVSGLDFVLHRDDDLSSNAPATLTSDIEILPLVYAKKFDVNAKFVRKLSRTVAVGG
jgi:hypothetical protein